MTTAQLAPGHVGINVTDLSRSIDFYRRALGFESLHIDDDGDRKFAFLGLDGELRVTLWQQSSGAFSTRTPGLHHLAFLVDSIDDVRTVQARLKDLGVTFTHEGVVAHGAGTSSGGIFFTDPDGIRLEVYTKDGVLNEPAPHGESPTCGFF